MKFNILALIIFIFSIGNAYSQIGNMSIIKGSVADAEKITAAYMIPLNNGLAMINQTLPIYYKSEKDVMFYFGVQFSSVYVPSDYHSYDVTKIGLEEYIPADPSITIAQTVFGEEKSILLKTKSKYLIGTPSGIQEVPLYEIETPKGIGSSVLPFAMVNIGGYFYGNYLTLKFIPKITFSDSEMDIYSIGFDFRHDITKMIGVLEGSKWNFSVLWGYQYTKMNSFFDIKPDENMIGLNFGSNNGPYDDQKLENTITTLPLGFNVGYEFGAFIIYGGPSIAFSTANVKLLGNYPVYFNAPLNLFSVVVLDKKDPFEYSQQINQWRLDLGTSYQFKNLIVAFNASIAEYTRASLIVGMSL